MLNTTLKFDAFAAVRGVHIGSRFDTPHEVQHMIAVVESMDFSICCHVDSIWCDSKACAFYFVTLKASTPTDGALFDRIPEKIALAFAAVGGHNGVQVTSANKVIDFGPSWPDFEAEAQG